MRKDEYVSYYRNADCRVRVTAVREEGRVRVTVEQVEGCDRSRRQRGLYTYDDDPENPKSLERWADNAYDAWSAGD